MTPLEDDDDTQIYSNIFRLSSFCKWCMHRLHRNPTGPQVLRPSHLGEDLLTYCQLCRHCKHDACIKLHPGKVFKSPPVRRSPHTNPTCPAASVAVAADTATTTSEEFRGASMMQEPKIHEKLRCFWGFLGSEPSKARRRWLLQNSRSCWAESSACAKKPHSPCRSKDSEQERHAESCVEAAVLRGLWSSC